MFSSIISGPSSQRKFRWKVSSNNLLFMFNVFTQFAVNSHKHAAVRLETSSKQRNEKNPQIKIF